MLERLAAAPRTLDELLEGQGNDAKLREALTAWLQLGVRLGLVQEKADRYRARGLLRTMAQPENDAALALLQEAASLHHKLIVATPGRLRRGELWSIEDQDGELTTRSSRALEVFQEAAIDRFFPRSGDTCLLEIGCGSACYIRYAAARNTSLHALGLDLQPDVAQLARAHVEQWGLADRVTIEAGDIRERTPVPDFDIATLYNNIYYFPVHERVDLLEHVKGFVRPGGFLLLTTCCQGGNPGMQVLNLWGAATATGGRLPTVAEMCEQLSAAGFIAVQAVRLVPGDAYYAFRGVRPDA